MRVRCAVSVRGSDAAVSLRLSDAAESAGPDEAVSVRGSDPVVSERESDSDLYLIFRYSKIIVNNYGAHINCNVILFNLQLYIIKL